MGGGNSMLSRSVAALSFAVLAAGLACAQVSVSPDTKKATTGTPPFGIITTVAGDGLAGYDGDNGPANMAQLHYAVGVAVDSSGNVYIADTGNNRIRKITAASGDIASVAGSQEAGYSGDKGPAVDALLDCPDGLALDAKNNPLSPIPVTTSCAGWTRLVESSPRSRDRLI
jgi:hypothetical protein